MRSNQVIKNSFWSLSGVILNILFGFINRTVFIVFLGAEYLGVNGLFTNVLSLLSLAELGFSSAVTYNLYAPITEKDEKKIAGIMNFYRFVYRIIAVIIMAVGLCLVPFLPYIVKGSTFPVSYLRIIYVLFLLDTGFSYFYSYNYTLAIADQKNYYVSKITFFSTPIMNVIKIGVLILTRSFIKFLAVSIILNLFINFLKASFVEKKYPLLKNHSEKLNKKEKLKLLSDVKNIFLGKVSTIVLTSTDNIVISAFINVVMVGVLSNYNMFIGYIQGFVNTALYAAQSSIGNVVATETKEYTGLVLKRLTRITLFIASFSCTALYCLSSDFIRILWGDNYVMKSYIVLIIMINCFIQMIKSPLWMTLGVCGFFEKDKYISFIGAVSNLFFSIVLVTHIGVAGVILGTIISQSIQFLLKSRLLYHRYFEKSSQEYLILMMQCILAFFLELGATAFCCHFIQMFQPIVNFLVKAAICVVIPNVITILLYYKTEEFDYLLNLLKRQLSRKIPARYSKAIND